MLGGGGELSYPLYVKNGPHNLEVLIWRLFGSWGGGNSPPDLPTAWCLPGGCWRGGGSDKFFTSNSLQRWREKERERDGDKNLFRQRQLLTIGNDPPYLPTIPNRSRLTGKNLRHELKEFFCFLDENASAASDLWVRDYGCGWCVPCKRSCSGRGGARRLPVRFLTQCHQFRISTVYSQRRRIPGVVRGCWGGGVDKMLEAVYGPLSTCIACIPYN